MILELHVFGSKSDSQIAKKYADFSLMCIMFVRSQ